MRTVLAAGSLLLMTGVAYLPALRAGFIWDDDAYVTANPTLAGLEGLRRIWFDVGATPQYYPLVFTTFWIEARVWQLQPWGFHAVNVLLHAASAIVLWRILRRLHIPGAWLAAAVFALHPVHVESVAWITERKNVLSGVFYLGAALVYLRFVGIGTTTESWGTGLRRFYLLALVLFAGALLSKTVTCSLPAVILLLLWWQRGRVTRRDLAALAPLFLLGAAMALLTAWVERYHVGATGPAWSLSFLERSLIAGRALWFYAGKLIWPARLTFIYPRWQIDASAGSQYLYPAAAIIIILALWLLRGRIGRAPLTAVLIFAGTLLPALGFINVYPMQYSFVADHFQYLPSIGLIALGIGMGARLAGGASNGQSPPAAAGHTACWPPAFRLVLSGLLLAVLSVLTWRQAGRYNDLETLWRDTIDKNPSCWLAHNNLGILMRNAHDREQAARCFREALRLKPDYALAHFNLGTLLADIGKTDEAVERLSQGLRYLPNDAQALNSLGMIRARQGRPEEAIRCYQQALDAKPGYAAAHFNLGAVLADLGRYAAAVDHFRIGLKAQADDFRARNRLGELLDQLGETRQAIVQYREAIRLCPGWVVPINNLAWRLATSPEAECRDGHEAIRLAEQACSATGHRDPAMLDTLAAALAESGRYSEAIATARQAAAEARNRNDLKMAKEIENRLAEYEAHRPWRTSSRPAP
ncbi:MAG: tetratricopeptide repeat protein [Phycisphaerae bacterium]|nr:tetratricopeptide repeat protein [Phycisphaerae bacterium]